MDVRSFSIARFIAFLRKGSRLCMATSMAALLASLAWPAFAENLPARVVSINLCTDQLAILLAAPGQLRSVSHLAADPESSAMSQEAAPYTLNYGTAEEVLLMKPTLVLAGTYTRQATVALLKKLGIRVEQFAPAMSLDGIRADLARMGRLLGREAEASRLIADFDLRLAAVSKSAQSKPVAAIVEYNSYTAGAGTLAAEVLTAAGYENLSIRLNIAGVGRLPLEAIVMAKPDLIVTSGERASAPAAGQDLFRHPALDAIKTARIPGRYWLCGGPFTAEAVERLAAAAP